MSLTMDLPGDFALKAGGDLVRDFSSHCGPPFLPGKQQIWNRKIGALNNRPAKNHPWMLTTLGYPGILTRGIPQLMNP